MRAAGAVSLLALVGALSCAGAAPSHASSCDKEVAARIRFPARQACWTYRGPATLFVGKFSSGQTISAQMTGEATDYDPRSGDATTVSRPRDPNVEGPGGYFFAVPDAPGGYDLCRSRDRNLSLQLLAVRHVGRAGRGQDLHTLTVAQMCACPQTSDMIVGCSETS
jgi:hypothetical protein